MLFLVLLSCNEEVRCGKHHACVNVVYRQLGPLADGRRVIAPLRGRACRCRKCGELAVHGQSPRHYRYARTED